MKIRKAKTKSGTTFYQVSYVHKGKRSWPQFSTKAEAQAFIDKVTHETYTNSHVTSGQTAPVAWAFEEFIELQTERVDDDLISPAELTNHEGRIRNHLSKLTYNDGLLIETPMTELTQNGIQKQIVKQLKKRVGRTTVKHIIMTLKQALDCAVHDDPPKLASNPAVGVTIEMPLNTTKLEKKRFTADLAEKLVAAAEGDFKLKIKFAIMTGLRQGEQRALRWTDIDFKRGVVQVRRKIEKESKRERERGKTKKAWRDVPINAELLAELKAHKLAQANHEHVFANADGSVGDGDNWRVVGLKKACRKAGVEVTWQELRHYFASGLVKAGFGKFDICRFMGHESIKTTEQHYLHWIDDPEADAAAAVKIGQAFNF